mmetsp:Transcript_49115/g.147873  ORF Transcript_49115/g.147873 Transcript_49115/m.147873 type:complete len:188 (-) Transcript_49115:160-723(-)
MEHDGHEPDRGNEWKNTAATTRPPALRERHQKWNDRHMTNAATASLSCAPAMERMKDAGHGEDGGDRRHNDAALKGRTRDSQEQVPQCRRGGAYSLRPLKTSGIMVKMVSPVLCAKENSCKRSTIATVWRAPNYKGMCTKMLLMVMSPKRLSLRCTPVSRITIWGGWTRASIFRGWMFAMGHVDQTS